MTTPIERLKHYVTGAIERGEAVAIAEQPARPKYLYDWEHDSGRIVFPDGSQCFLQGEEAFHVFEQVEACAGPRADHLQTDILNEYNEVADVYCSDCKLWVNRDGHACEGTEKGAASILITLDNGNITVTHGTDKVTLLEIPKAKAGSWESIWATLHALKGN